MCESQVKAAGYAIAYFECCVEDPTEFPCIACESVRDFDSNEEHNGCMTLARIALSAAEDERETAP